MRMVDIIEKKKKGEALTFDEIAFAVNGFVSGEIPDYQMSALLMAICFMGMNERETAKLTKIMANSGDMNDLSHITGIKADKHSTGGVGDKTSFVVVSILAACDIKMAKMSGRGLGHTGGTIDKLEAIPNFKTTLTPDEFIKQVNDIGLSIIGQSGNMTPADKKIYALRDVTGTVASIPLIASSIMSKKLAAGADYIMLDVKVGSGAFMQTLDDAINLAKAMVAIGEQNGRKTAAIISEMDIPLGVMVGNSLEIIEAVDTLKGKGVADFTNLCIELSARLLFLCGKGDISSCRNLAKEAISNGSAYKKFCEMVTAQGGDVSYIEDTSKFEKAKNIVAIKSDRAGYISKIDTYKVGIASMMVNAGRETKESILDYSAGVEIIHKVPDYVEKGETLALIYHNCDKDIKDAEQNLKSAFTISDNAPQPVKMIKAYVDINGVEIL